MSGRLPNLLIAGVTKAGTTSLFSYLAQHPEICGSSLKETEYFSPLLYPDGELAPQPEYARYFRHCNDERYVLEATPNYWYGGTRLLDATETMLGAPKYIVSLRDPIDRFWSEFTYMHSKALLPRDMSAGAYLDRCEGVRHAGTAFAPDNRQYRTLSTGFYGDHLAPWLDRLDGRLRIVFFEDLCTDAAAVVSSLFEWLQLDAVPVHALDLAAQNTTTEVRSAAVQRIGQRVARATDVITRRQPQLKRLLVDAFARVNRGGERQADLDDATRARLVELFAPANAALAVTLRNAGYDRVPDWVRGAGG